MRVGRNGKVRSGEKGRMEGRGGEEENEEEGEEEEGEVAAVRVGEERLTVRLLLWEDLRELSFTLLSRVVEELSLTRA